MSPPLTYICLSLSPASSIVFSPDGAQLQHIHHLILNIPREVYKVCQNCRVARDSAFQLLFKQYIHLVQPLVIDVHIDQVDSQLVNLGLQDLQCLVLTTPLRVVVAIASILGAVWGCVSNEDHELDCLCLRVDLFPLQILQSVVQAVLHCLVNIAATLAHQQTQEGFQRVQLVA